MKLISSFVILFLLLVSSVHSQLDKGYLTSAVLLELPLSCGGSYSGSGFFYTHDSLVYLVTAKHVLGKDSTDANGKKYFSLLSSECVATYYYSGHDLSVKQRLVVDLVSAQQKQLLKTHPTQDIAIICVAEKNGHLSGPTPVVSLHANRMDFNTFDKQHLGIFEAVVPTSDIYLFGYPKSIGNFNDPLFEYDRPLVQKGIVSALNYSDHKIILSGAVFPGNSGGPVIQVQQGFVQEEGLTKWSTKLTLIGVVIKYIFALEYNTGDVGNSGYSVVLPIDHLIELL